MTINTVFEIEPICKFETMMHCLKCGADLADRANSIPSTIFYRYKKPSTVILDGKSGFVEIPEHLKIQCQKCGYTWREHCKS